MGFGKSLQMTENNPVIPEVKAPKPGKRKSDLNLNVDNLSDSNFADVRKENADIDHLFSLRDIFKEMQKDWNTCDSHRDELQAKIDELEAKEDCGLGNQKQMELQLGELKDELEQVESDL